MNGNELEIYLMENFNMTIEKAFDIVRQAMHQMTDFDDVIKQQRAIYNKNKGNK